MATTAEQRRVGTAIDQLRVLIESGQITSVDQVYEAFGITEAVERESLASIRRSYLAPKELSQADLKAVNDLIEVFGKAPILEQQRILEPEEAAAWARELVIMKRLKAVFDGRIDAARDTIFASITEQTGDPDETGQIRVPEEGVRLTKEVATYGGNPDLNRLEDVLPPKVWEAITDEIVVPVRRVVNEDKLLAAMMPTKDKRNRTVRPKVSLEDLKAIETKGQKRASLHVRPL